MRIFVKVFLPTWCCDEITEQESILIPDVVMISKKKNSPNLFLISDSIYEIDIIDVITDKNS